MADRRAPPIVAGNACLDLGPGNLGPRARGQGRGRSPAGLGRPGKRGDRAARTHAFFPYLWANIRFTMGSNKESVPL